MQVIFPRAMNLGKHEISPANFCCFLSVRSLVFGTLSFTQKPYVKINLTL